MLTQDSALLGKVRIVRIVELQPPLGGQPSRREAPAKPSLREQRNRDDLGEGVRHTASLTSARYPTHHRNCTSTRSHVAHEHQNRDGRPHLSVLEQFGTIGTGDRSRFLLAGGGAGKAAVAGGVAGIFGGVVGIWIACAVCWCCVLCGVAGAIRSMTASIQSAERAPFAKGAAGPGPDPNSQSLPQSGK